MSFLSELLLQAGERTPEIWFQEIAELLLNGCQLLVAGAPHRLLEIEFYYHAEEHLDPFAHCDPLQKSEARWYFHREAGGYRGGSFKGLDISFAPEGEFGGILIRSLESPDGHLINGCSLCVDHLLSQTGHKRVAELDEAIAERKVWEQSSPLCLEPCPDLEQRMVLATARVGLTLKRMYQHREMPAYIMRNYRFLSDPKIKKGKIHSVIALHKMGRSPDEIRTLAKSPARSIQGYLRAFQEGLELENFNRFRGRSLKVADLCQLHGAWQRHYGD